MGMSRALGLALAMVIGCASCGGPPSSEDVAITFLELYVFNVDQESALKLADGLAADKLRKEMAEVAGVRRDSFTPGQRPLISRELIDVQTAEDGQILYTFRIEVRPKGGHPTRQRMLIHVERRQPDWRVVDYEFWPESSAAE